MIKYVYVCICIPKKVTATILEWCFFLDDDKPLLLKMVVRKPIYLKIVLGLPGYLYIYYVYIIVILP